MFEGFEESSNFVDQSQLSSSYQPNNLQQDGSGSSTLLRERATNNTKNNIVQKKKRRVARTYLKIDFQHNQDSFLFPLQEDCVEGKVVSNLPYSHKLFSAIIENSNTGLVYRGVLTSSIHSHHHHHHHFIPGVSTSSSSALRKSSEISFERVHSTSSNSVEGSSGLWKVICPSLSTFYFIFKCLTLQF
jgi:hypothetical protein